MPPWALVVHAHGYASPGADVAWALVRAGAHVCGMDVVSNVLK